MSNTKVFPIPSSDCFCVTFLLSSNRRTNTIAKWTTTMKQRANNPTQSTASRADQRLKELGINLPNPPQPFGTYAEAVQTGSLLFLSGMLPTEGGQPKLIGRIGAELNVEAGKQAAHVAALNAIAVAREHLGSLNKVARIVRLSVLVATGNEIADLPKVADGASELLQSIFGKDKNPCRVVYGVASLPLGVPVELELIFEVTK